MVMAEKAIPRNSRAWLVMGSMENPMIASPR